MSSGTNHGQDPEQLIRSHRQQSQILQLRHTSESPTLVNVRARQLRQRLQTTLATTLDSSDAEASSDLSSLSEVDQLPESEPGFSEFETPLGGRWDMAAHWQLGDYSEGVEGDDDDDDGEDDEERDMDTDLSESPAARRTGIHLDFRRIHEILSSNISTLNEPAHDTLLGPMLEPRSMSSSATSTSRGHGNDEAESLHISTTAGSALHIPSETSRQEAPSWLRRNGRARPFTPPQPFMDMNPTPSLSPEQLMLSRHDDVHTDSYHGDMEDSQGESNQEAQSSTGAGGTGGADEATVAPIALENSMHTSRQSSSSSSQTTAASFFAIYGPRSESARARALLLRPSPPLLTREERRHIFHVATGRTSDSRESLEDENGSLGMTQSTLNRDRDRRLITRHAVLSSPTRTHLSPYWGALSRQTHRMVTSGSLRSSRSSSPISTSSATSSRTASPMIDHPPLVSSFKPLEGEDEEGGQTRFFQPGAHGISQTPSSFVMPDSSMGGDAGVQHHRRAVSTSIVSLPLFVSSAFSPNTTPVGGTSSGLSISPETQPNELSQGIYNCYRPLKRNHPRRPCCFLQPGQKFHGTQNLKAQASSVTGQRTGQMEEWDVKVTISAVDYEAATVFGLMEAMDVPMSESNVVTFWEGEIIDFENHNFWTKKWAAKSKTDVDHWSRMAAFEGVEEKYIIRGAKNGKFVGHINQKYIFMRWKEKHFVNSSEHTSGLTIAGFYYIAMRRSTGSIEGFYHDQQSTPFQHLCLEPTFENRGFSSALFEVA
ncbi:hypothetical protein BG004_005190 [Podila humilis]|nr:hypothetical protein BG004_005190 [Podila humilis]